MSQDFYLGLVRIIMPPLGNDMHVDMVAASSVDHDSFQPWSLLAAILDWGFG